MWFVTDNGLLNSDFVARIAVSNDLVNFYKEEVPASGNASNPDQVIMGTIRCGSAPEASQLFQKLTHALVTSPLTTEAAS